MPGLKKTREVIAAHFGAGETFVALEAAQVKTPDSARRMRKDVAVSTAASIAIGAVTGFGMVRTTLPPQLWVVITNQRLLMLGRPATGGAHVGDLVFAAPLDRLSLTEKAGLLREITICDKQNGEPVVRLNFGMRKRAAAAVLAAAA